MSVGKGFSRGTFIAVDTKLLQIHTFEGICINTGGVGQYVHLSEALTVCKSTRTNGLHPCIADLLFKWMFLPLYINTINK